MGAAETPWDASAYLDAIVEHGDEMGHIANARPDDLRDVVALAAARLRVLAAAPVVDDETAAMVARLHGGDGEILRAIGSALNAVYMERARGGKVSDQAEEVRVHRAVLESLRPAADRLEALSAPVVDVAADAVAEAMQRAWNDYVTDSGCYPDDFTIEGSGLRASFGRSNFARMVAMRLSLRTSDGA